MPAITIIRINLLKLALAQPPAFPELPDKRERMEEPELLPGGQAGRIPELDSLEVLEKIVVALVVAVIEAVVVK